MALPPFFGTFRSTIIILLFPPAYFACYYWSNCPIIFYNLCSMNAHISVTHCLPFPPQRNLSTIAMDNKDKGKEIPLQAWGGPEGPRRLSLPDFKTTGT